MGHPTTPTTSETPQETTEKHETPKLLAIRPRHTPKTIYINPTQILTIWEGKAGAVFRLTNGTIIETRYSPTQIRQLLQDTTEIVNIEPEQPHPEKQHRHTRPKELANWNEQDHTK